MTASDRLDFRSYRAVTERHRHDWWQLVLPVRGVLDMEVDGRAGRVLPCQGALIPASIDHAFQAEGENRFLVADSVSVPLGDRLADRFHRQAFFPVDPAIRALIDYRTATETGPEQAGYWCALLLAALGNGTDRARDPEERGVDRAVALMRARLGETVTIGMLAEVSGLPAHRLTQAFRRRHGESPYAYLMQLRLARAQALLAGSDLPIGEIAYRTGFADQSALTRQMRRAGFESPAAYRRGQRSGQLCEMAKSRAD